MNQIELELLYSDRVTREMIKDCLEESEVTQAMHKKELNSYRHGLLNQVSTLLKLLEGSTLLH